MGNASMRRSSKVGLVVSLTLVFGIALGTLPAVAAAASTAFVNVHNVLAGQDGKVFTVRVNNTESSLPGALGGATINEVRVRPPVDLIDAVLPGSSGPSGWDDIRVVGNPPAEIRFRGGTLAPGANGIFTIAADVRDTLTQDLGENWRIRVSSNDGNNHLASGPTGEGLTTTVRVLQVQAVSVVSPSGAADDRDGDGLPEITGTQGNVCVRTRVFNAAASPLTVTPDLDGGSLSVGPARAASATPCSAPPLAGGAAAIPAGSFADFDFVASADNVQSRTTSELQGTASASGASTPNTPDPDDDDFLATQGLIIEPKARFQYVANSLSPRAVVPGSLDKTFTIRFNKIPAGSPPLPSLDGDFKSAFCNTTLLSPTSLGGGAANNQTASYAPCDIADIDDGRYQPTARFGYTDGNGLIQALVPVEPNLEQVRLDSLIPDVDIEITPPAPQVTAVPPVEPAITDGQPFPADGDVTDTSPETGEDTPCGPNPSGSAAPLPCTLESAELIQLPSGGRIDVTNQCSLSSMGSLSCNITVPEGGFAAGTTQAQLEVTVQDETENLGTGLSSLVDVDIIDPVIEEARTRRGGTITVAGQQVPGQRRTIVVRFNEPVENSNNPNDWLVEDGSTKTVCNVEQTPDKQTVNLTTCQELNADTDGTLVYSPALLTGSPYHDRVGQETATPAEPALIDGIEPLAPTFDTVNGRGLQDDGPPPSYSGESKFFFNTQTPEVSLIQTAPASAEDPAIASGYTVEVYEETNGQEGLQRVGDTQICGDVATADSITVSCEFPLPERESQVYAISIDTNTNPGQAVSTDFVLDVTRPAFAAATVAGDQITVTFNEPVPERTANQNASANWNYFAFKPNGQRTSPQVTDVSAGTTIAEREITYDSQENDPATLDPDRLKYFFDLPNELDRYEDRAGNQFLDSELLI